MMPSTKFCSNLTDGVPGGSVVHTGSPWTLKITSILLTSSRDPILGSKIRFITILAVFTGTSYREVLYLGLEFIGLWLICTKYVNFLMSHTQHMYPSCPTIRWPLLSLLSVIPSTCNNNDIHIPLRVTVFLGILLYCRYSNTQIKFSILDKFIHQSLDLD